MTSKLRSLALAALVAASGCGTGGDSGGVAEVQVALSTVPTGVQCVQINATSGMVLTTAPLATVAAGASSASVSFGQLPAGDTSFVGYAYNVACSSVNPSQTSAATWISDPVTATLSAGSLTVLQMTFRRINPVSVNANFVDNVAEIILGTNAAYARMADGTVKQWGTWGSGSSTTPVAVPSLTDAAQVVAGANFACARKGADGSVWCWGLNSNGQMGSAPSMTPVTTPVKVTLPAAVNNITAGDLHMCANSAVTNAIYCWGANASGQLGNNSTTLSAIAVTPNATGRVIAGGSETCAIDSNSGALSCWGANNFGQLGTGSMLSAQLTPTPVALKDVVGLALGASHACAVRVDGTLRCWGANANGQIGDGTTTQRPVPTQIMISSDVAQVQVGTGFTCVRHQGGTVNCWGAGTYLGDGVGDDRGAPSSTPLLSNVAALHVDVGTACAELTNHTVSCWGANSSGQIGDGTFNFAFQPTLAKLQ